MYYLCYTQGLKIFYWAGKEKGFVPLFSQARKFSSKFGTAIARAFLKLRFPGYGILLKSSAPPQWEQLTLFDVNLYSSVVPF